MGASILFVHALVEAVEQTGVSRERLLEGSSLDPGKLAQVDARLSVGALDALLDRALLLTGDPAFGLRMGDMANPGNYNLTAQLVAHARTLREAIECMQRFYRLLTDRPFWRFVEESRTASLLFDAGPGASPARRFRCELTMTNFYKLLRHFDPRARPRLVAFDYPAPAHHSEYTRIFGGVERFGQEFTGIVFDRALLASAHLHRDPELHATIVEHAGRRVLQLGNEGYAARVRRHILESDSPGRHDMRSVARALGLSARSLRRRLTEEETSFRDVADAALGTLARRLVAGEDHAIEAVAHAMGFSHPSAFHRAFKRWTGATPAATRSSPPPAAGPAGAAHSRAKRATPARRSQSS